MIHIVKWLNTSVKRHRIYYIGISHRNVAGKTLYSNLYYKNHNTPSNEYMKPNIPCTHYWVVAIINALYH